MIFVASVLLDATLAETTSGWKAVIGRIAQPLFRRQGGGSKLPIRISGPREQLEFGLDVVVRSVPASHERSLSIESTHFRHQRPPFQCLPLSDTRFRNGRGSACGRRDHPA